MYKIGGEYDFDDKIFLYWSNADGWVTQESATIFNLQIDQEIFLPDGAKFIQAVGTAPDLLSALELAVRVMRDHDIDESMSGEFEIFTDALDAATN